LDLKPAGRATHASPALVAPLVPAPRLAQGWWAEQCGTARLVWRSAPGSRLRRARSRRPDQPRFGLFGWMESSLHAQDRSHSSLRALLKNNAATTCATPKPVPLLEILYNDVAEGFKHKVVPLPNSQSYWKGGAASVFHALPF
jgi:hypothetical protein